MKIYHIHPDTGEYVGSADATLDPLELQINKVERWLLPAHATHDEPPVLEEGKARVFINGVWSQVEDHRGKKIYHTETVETATITGLGPIPPGFTELAPCEYPKWDGGAWVVDETKAPKVPTKEELAAQEEAAACESLIQAKIREQAISALKVEGKLTVDGKIAVVKEI
jgi:hypothetical protein